MIALIKEPPGKALGLHTRSPGLDPGEDGAGRHTLQSARSKAYTQSKQRKFLCMCLTVF